MAVVDLLAVGEAFEDLVFFGLPHLPVPGEELKTNDFLHTIGGGAVITAVAASRLGLRTGIVSALGRAAVERLRHEHVRVRNLRRGSEPVAITVSLSTRTDRSFVTFNAVNESLESRLVRALAPRGARAARHVHFALFPRQARRWANIVAALRDRGATTSWDFGWNEALNADRHFLELASLVDYLFLNEAESTLYSRSDSLAAAIEFWRGRAVNAIIKLGARGCRWVSSNLDLAAPARRVRAVDATGAGDAFNGGFLYARLRGMQPRECLRIANAVGGLSTRAPGGLAGLPRRNELT